MDIKNIAIINSIKINRKNFYNSAALFFLLTVKSLEILPKDSQYGFIFEPFALNQYIFVALINKKLLL